MLITYPEGRILSRSTISNPGNTLTPRRTTLRSLDKSWLNERPTTCRQARPYTRIGDQLELVAKLKGQKDKAVRQAEVRTLMEDLDIETSYAKYPRQMSVAQKQRAKGAPRTEQRRRRRGSPGHCFQEIRAVLCLQRQQAIRNETTNELTTGLSEFPCRLIELAD